MRLKKFMINEEDIIQKGLSVDEPEAQQEYSEEEVNGYLAPVISALAKLREKGIDSEQDEAIYRDLMDKKNKWEKAAGGGGEEPAAEAPPEGEEVPPEGEEGGDLPDLESSEEPEGEEVPPEGEEGEEGDLPDLPGI